MKNRIVLIVVSALFVVIALAMIYSKEKVLTDGTVIELETQPVDPRDLLRGDYVILSYKINNVNFDKEFGEVTPGREVFAQLEKRGKYWEIKKAYSEVQPDMGVFIQGIVKENRWQRNRVDYGIESYFVPEGKGKKIENLMGWNTKDKITVEVAVDKEGKAVIKQLLLNGQPYSFK